MHQQILYVVPTNFFVQGLFIKHTRIGLEKCGVRPALNPAPCCFPGNNFLAANLLFSDKRLRTSYELKLYFFVAPYKVDTNVGRIAVRLGWVPIQPLPESLQLHLVEL